MSQLDASYAACQQLARRAASNFYFSFLLLPRDKRRAMCALYALLRKVDDLADDPDRSLHDRRRALDALREALHGADGLAAGDPILPALLDTVTRYQIPREYLSAVIDGVEMDLAGTRYETFDDLEQYCYRVASVVGMACIHVWGFRDERALELARQCGIAFQMTNILRDVKEDAERGRVYLPREDMRRFGYTVEELERYQANDRFLALMQFEIARCERFYDAAQELEPLLAPDGQRVLRAMNRTYRGLLRKIKRRPADVFCRRIALGSWEKFTIAAQALLARPRSADRHSWETATP